MGHRRRMEALAAALESRGCTAELRAAEEPVTADDVVVVDSYRHRADDRAQFHASLVVAVDDLERDLRVDLLVDPSAERAAVHRAARVVLSGPRYAFVDRHVLAKPRCDVAPEVRHVLIAMGAADEQQRGPRLAQQLLELLPGAEVRLVVGPWSSADVPIGVLPVMTTAGLAAELAAADLVVTAGGVTLLEALSTGCPTIAISVAPNQDAAVRTAASVGAALHATLDDAATAAAELAADPERRGSLARAGRALVDGEGAQRVAAEILGLRRRA